MSREERLADLLERWEDVLARGLVITPAELCRDMPELLDEFQQVLARVRTVDAILQGGKAAVSPRDLVGRIDAGRYRPISYVDEGGQGLIFQAEDKELPRLVALKWMRPLGALDAAQRRRFLLEAEITAQLDHPGIVPVYGLGEDREGRPYYAMRFVRGKNLGDVARRFHEDGNRDAVSRNLQFHRLLQSFLAVCETIAYAHARGVVHRDLKPGNIRLGPFGETLVLDWGLAKRLDCPPPEEDPERTALEAVKVTPGLEGSTLPGRAEGSPAYMAPEQARGEVDRVGPATDVYGLGATLYMLLTGRPPFQGKSATEVIEQVKPGALLRPRQVKPAVPAALEAVCLKAMAYRAEDRYGSARALAADIERWLADEPVSARREPLTSRLRRWVKRNRTLVSTSVAMLLVAVLLLSVLGIVLNEKNRLLEVRNDELDTARKAAADERDSFVESIAGMVKDADMEAGKFRQAFLKKANDSVLKFAPANATIAAQMDHKMVWTHLSLARISKTKNETDAALKEYNLALTLAEKAAKRQRDNPEAQRDLSVCYNDLGNLNLRLNKLGAALEFLHKDLSISKKLAEAAPQNADAQRDLAITYRSLGETYFTQKASDRAVKHYEEALTISQRLAVEYPKDGQFQCDLSVTYYALGSIHFQAGQYEEALTRYTQDLKVSRALADANRSNLDDQNSLALTLRKLRETYVKLNQPHRALAMCDQEQVILKRQAFPNAAEIKRQRDLSFAFFELAGIYWLRRAPEQALALYHEDLEISRRLAFANPRSEQEQDNLAVTLEMLGKVHQRLDQFEEAKKHFQEALSVCRAFEKLGGGGSKVIRARMAALTVRIELCDDAPNIVADPRSARKAPADRRPRLLSLAIAALAHRKEAAKLIQAAELLEKDADKASLQNKASLQYDAACGFALAVPLVSGASDRKQLIDRSLTLLRAAVSKDVPGLDHLQQDADLDALRDLEGFRELLSGLEQNNGRKSSLQKN
jgi:serine/threonine-protein kinase